MTIRGLALAAAFLVLSGCDSGNVPTPTERLEQGASVAPDVPADEALLRTDGLTAGPEAFYFSAGQTEVIASLDKVLGAPAAMVKNEECSAGPMEFAVYEAGLTVNFQNDTLVGWNTSDGSGKVRITGDVQIGTDRARAEGADGFAPIDGSTLGEEFSLGSQIGGFIEEDAVSLLYAGTQCFFR